MTDRRNDALDDHEITLLDVVEWSAVAIHAVRRVEGNAKLANGGAS